MNKCLGCGINLQNQNPTNLGYTSDLEKNFCQRCFKLKNYGKYTNVSLNNEDYLKIINSIPVTNLVLYITDILNLSITNLDKFKKVILVVTKKDLLPKSIKDKTIINYLKDKYPNIIDIIIISSIKNYNLDKLYNKIDKYFSNKPIYLIGNTNSGKSTLINKLIDNYSTQNNNKITTSIYPSTTLNTLEIDLGKIKLIDTPGLIDDNNITNYLTPEELKKITPKKEIKPKTCQLKPGQGSLIIDKYVRIDYQTSITNSFVIYANNYLDIRFSSLHQEIPQNFIKKNYVLSQHQDIVLPGLGFIKFVKPIKITIYCPEYLKPHIRDNLI